MCDRHSPIHLVADRSLRASIRSRRDFLAGDAHDGPESPGARKVVERQSSDGGDGGLRMMLLVLRLELETETGSVVLGTTRIATGDPGGGRDCSCGWDSVGRDEDGICAAPASTNPHKTKTK